MSVHLPPADSSLRLHERIELILTDLSFAKTSIDDVHTAVREIPMPIISYMVILSEFVRGNKVSLKSLHTKVSGDEGI